MHEPLALDFTAMGTVYILQCRIKATRSMCASSFGLCAGSLAAAALLRNRHLHD